jgi:hypothetical protein
MPTPIVFDAFSRIMANGFYEVDYIHMPTLFLSFFGRPETGSFTVFSPDANVFDIEITRGDERLAALVQRGIGSRFGGTRHEDTKMGEGTTFSRKYPLIEESGNIGADELNNRVIPLEPPYGGWTREERAMYKARQLYLQMVRRTIRLMEYLAGQSIQLGVQSTIDITDVTTQIYDWRRAAANTITPAHGWGNAAGVPITDLDAACAILRYTSRGAAGYPDGVLMGGTAMTYFLANAQVSTNYANHLYFDLMQFSNTFKPNPKFDRFVRAGAIPFGVLRLPSGYELTVFTYPEIYWNSAGAAAYYLNQTRAVVFCSGARCDRYFGPPEQLTLTSQDQARMMERFGFNPAAPMLPMNIQDPGSTVLPQMFYPDAYESDSRKNMTVRVQSAPAFATTMTDAFATLVGVGTTT